MTGEFCNRLSKILTGDTRWLQNCFGIIQELFDSSAAVCFFDKIQSKKFTNSKESAIWAPALDHSPYLELGFEKFNMYPNMPPPTYAQSVWGIKRQE